MAKDFHLTQSKCIFILVGKLNGDISSYHRGDTTVDVDGLMCPHPSRILAPTQWVVPRKVSLEVNGFHRDGNEEVMQPIV